MLNNNVSSCKEQILSPEDIKSTNNICRSCRSILPLATAVICLLNSNQSALGVDINTKITAEKFTNSYSGSIEHHNYSHERQHSHNSSGLLPRILSLIAYPFRNHSTVLPKADQSQRAFHFDAMGGSFVQDLAPLYLSQAELSSTKEFLTNRTVKSITPINNLALSTIVPKSELYTVKTGDTINLISDKYQVSSQELIALNNIQDSNVILTNQKLKLPANKLNKSELAEITLTKTTFPQNSQTISKRKAKIDISTDDLQEKRLANLRAEINQMRSEIEQERKNSHNLNEEKLDLASSANPKNSQDFNSILEEDILVKLPPLPSSEEYLPEAFDGYSWPAQGILSSGYGWRWGRLHKGIDIAAPVGTPIFAAAAGEVVSAGWNNGGYGNLVKLEHLDGSITLYAHNNRILVNNGQRVSKGEQIAEMGNTGFSTGSHLHFEIHSRNRGVVNPLALLQK